MSDIEEALSRLESGYYNSDSVSEENPGGMGNGGHVENLPALLKDTGDVVRVSTNAVEGSEAARDASQGFRDQSEAHKNASQTARAGSEAARDTALAHRNTAEEHKNAAQTAQAGAEGARDTALAHRNTAEGHKNAAQTAQAGAEGARDTALAHRNSAEGHKNAAQTAQAGAEAALGALADEVDQAQAARNKAEEWADKGEDQPVEEGPDRFSAKHWALKGEALVNELPYPNLKGLSATPTDRFLKTGADQSLIARTAAEFRGDIGANSASNLDEGTLPDARLAAAVYRRANILGAVGLLGGVPTGAIIQEGSGPMGWWVRLTNGLQICFVEFDDTANGWTTAVGNLFRGATLTTWTFPVQFAATPAIASFSWRNSTSIHGASYRSASTIQCLLIPWSAQSVAASVTKTLSALAIGRF